MEDLYPPIEPAQSGWLEAGDGHRLYFEVCGNLQGAPVLFLHGGPGSSSNPGHRRFFDPSFYRIVLFDQRGCGRSTPSGETHANTTADLLEDIERLRRHLGVERWLLFGGSWGSTLALAYAEAHPQRVCGLVLRGVFLASGAEVAWYLEGLRRFLPEAWEALAARRAASGLRGVDRALPRGHRARGHVCSAALERVRERNDGGGRGRVERADGGGRRPARARARTAALPVLALLSRSPAS